MEHLDNNKDTSNEISLKVFLPIILLLGLFIGILPLLIKGTGALINNSIGFFSRANISLTIIIWILAAILGYFIGEKLDRRSGNTIKTSIVISFFVLSISVGLILIFGKWQASPYRVFSPVPPPSSIVVERPVYYPLYVSPEPVYPVVDPIVRPSVQRLDACRQSCEIHSSNPYDIYRYSQYSQEYAYCVQQCAEENNDW